MRRPPAAPLPDPPDLAQWIAADRRLQSEIDRAMARLAECVDTGVDLRLAQILSAVMEPSWKEHMSFQEEALFPLLVRLHGVSPDMAGLLARLGDEHGTIGTAHDEVAVHLHHVAGGWRAAKAAGRDLAAALGRALSLRERHGAAESSLADALPPRLGEDDQAAMAQWFATRAAHPFPLNLVIETGQ